MIKYVFLDDIRNPIKEDGIYVWYVFRKVPLLKEFCLSCCTLGYVLALSLDHDLGENEETGLSFLNWLEEKVYLGEIPRENILWIRVHSANPVGAAVMRTVVTRILL